MGKFRGYAETAQKCSILDLIICLVMPSRQSRLKSFKKLLQKTLLKGFINLDFKKNLTQSLLKSKNWFAENLREFEFQLYNTALVMKDILPLASLNFAVLSTFETSFFHDENKVDLARTQRVLTKFKSFVNLVEYSQLQFPENADAFLKSDNWEMMVRIVGVLESVINVEFDSVERNPMYYDASYYEFYSAKLHMIMLKSLLGVMRIQSPEHRHRLLQKMEHLLFAELAKIEHLTRQLSRDQTTTQDYGPIRVGFVLRYLGLVLFVKYFVSVQNDTIVLKKNEVSSSAKADFQKNLVFSEAQKLELYDRLLQNHFFYIQRLSGEKNKHSDQISADKFYKIPKIYVSLFKALFFLDPAFGHALVAHTKRALQEIVDGKRTSKCERLLRHMFNFILEVTCNENCFEDLFVALHVDFSLDGDLELTRAQLEHLFDQVPGVCARVNNFVGLKSFVGIKEMEQMNRFPSLDSASVRQFLEFIFERLCKFDKEKKRFVCRKKNKNAFFQNLFYGEENLFNQVMVEFQHGCVRPKQVHLFSWDSPRHAVAVGFWVESGLSQWLTQYFADFRGQLCSLKQNQDVNLKSHTETDALLESMFVFCELIQDKQTLTNFFPKLIPQTGEDLSTLLSEMAKKLACIDSAEVQKATSRSEPQQAEKLKKRRQKRLLRRIGRKSRKKMQLISFKDAPELTQFQKCLACHEPFSESRPPTTLVKIHRYQPEKLLKGRDHLKNDLHLVTSCGHEYHLECVKEHPDYDDEQNSIECIFCKQSADLILNKMTVESDFEIFFNQLELEISEHNYGSKNVLDFLLAPYFQTIRNMKLISGERYRNNILPVLRSFSGIFYASNSVTRKHGFTKSLKSKFDKVQKYKRAYFKKTKKKFKELLEEVCSELLCAEYVIFKHLAYYRDGQGRLRDEAQRKMFINQSLQDQIEKSVWKFVVLKLLQQESLRLEDINNELIIAGCYDLLKVVVIVEEALSVDYASGGGLTAQDTPIDEKIRGDARSGLIDRNSSQVQRFELDPNQP